MPVKAPKPTEYPPTPTLDRMKEVAPFSQKIGEFLEWLQGERGLTLCNTHEHTDDCHTMNMRTPEFRRWVKEQIKDGKLVWADEAGALDRLAGNLVSKYEYDNGRFNQPRCGCYHGEFMSSHATIEKLLHEFFEIDPKLVENERRAVLDYVRKHQ